MFYCLLLIVGSFMAGALPAGFLTGKLLRGIDLRQAGSGNLGATNTFRVLGVWPGVFVLAVDILKGFAPVFWAPALVGVERGETAAGFMLVVAIGSAAVAGHIFSPFVGFRGGKGVATATGVFLGLCPGALLLSLGVWLALMAASRIVSLASLGAAVSLPFSVYLTVAHDNPGYLVIQGFSIIITILVAWTHRSNIDRLLRGEEEKLSGPRTGGDAR
ncbi:MAG: glycerol-3-phosphate 1-O-acyltransferase PlsY [Gemmatimonadota bacterium]|nr:glycerol-3-phosphate 1-O-acyltransferase PlsY [Gemmatimonadota bacterium]